MKPPVELRAKDIMQRNIISLLPEMSLRQAAQILHESKISGAPVITQEKELVGVLSQSDLLRQAIDAQFAPYFQGGFYYEIPLVGDGSWLSGARSELTKVEEVMSPYVITASPEDSVAAVARSLREHRFHRLIVAEAKKPVGIITTLDLLQVLEDLEH